MAKNEETKETTPKKWDGDRILCNGCKFLKCGLLSQTPTCEKNNLVLRAYFSGRPFYIAMYKNCKDKK